MRHFFDLFDLIFSVQIIICLRNTYLNFNNYLNRVNDEGMIRKSIIDYFDVYLITLFYLLSAASTKVTV